MLCVLGNGNKNETVGYKFDAVIRVNFVNPTINIYFNTTFRMNTPLIFQVYWSQTGRVQQIGSSAKFTCSKLYRSFDNKSDTIISKIRCFLQRLIKTLFACKPRDCQLLLCYWFGTTVQQTESDSANRILDIG